MFFDSSPCFGVSILFDSILEVSGLVDSNFELSYFEF